MWSGEYAVDGEKLVESCDGRFHIYLFWCSKSAAARRCPRRRSECSGKAAVPTAPRGLWKANEYAAGRSARARPRSELRWGCACAWIRGRVPGKGLGAAKRRVAVESDVRLTF